MLLTNIILPLIISTQPLPSLEDTVKVDLTSDKKEETIIYKRSYTDSSFCRILEYNPSDSSYIEIWERKFMLNKGEDYQLFVGDYNDDGVNDFTVELPHSCILYFFRWDEEKRTFIFTAPDSSSIEPSD